MRRTGRAALCALALLIGLLALPAQADAAVVTVKHVERTRLVADGETKAQKVPCPSGSSVVGGGVNVVGGNGFTKVNSTTPYDGADEDTKPDDGWLGAISHKAGGADRLMTVFAVCATSGKYKYLSHRLQLPTPTPGSDGVACPSGMVVTGGGVSLDLRSAKAYVSSTAPFDSPAIDDPDAVREDGWGGTVSLDGTKDAYMRVTAICTVPDGTIWDYPETTKTLSADGFAVDATAECDPGWVVTGGGVTHNDDFAVSVHSTEPFDSPLDGNSRREDGWTGKLSNPSGASVMTTIAICVTDV
jgi:hypothetical protein